MISPPVKPIEFKARLVLIGLNQSKFARLINVSANTVSSNLKGDMVPVLYQLALIALEQQYNEEDNN